MSEKKNSPEEEPQDDNSGIEIITVGVKNSYAEAKNKEPEINIIAPAQNKPEEEPKQEAAQVPPPHTHLGEKEDEQKIREHVEQIRQNLSQEISEEQEEEVSQSNISKDQMSAQSDRSQRSQISGKSRRRRADKSNYESNQERREDLPTSRKCFNKLCSSKKIYKKIRSKVEENKYRFFCRVCYENYYNNLYCQFCQQIYSTNGENQDDDKWIGCDHCDRWNHIDCERKYRDRNIVELKDKNMPYDCLACSQRVKSEGGKIKKGEKEQDEKLTIKQKIEINKDQRTLIFHKKIESFPNLEYFLQNYSFRLWMNQGQIREDIEHLRSVCLKSAQDDVNKNKFKKVKTQ